MDGYQALFAFILAAMLFSVAVEGLKSLIKILVRG